MKTESLCDTRRDIDEYSRNTGDWAGLDQCVGSDIWWLVSCPDPPALGERTDWSPLGPWGGIISPS